MDWNLSFGIKTKFHHIYTYSIQAFYGWYHELALISNTSLSETNVASWFSCYVCAKLLLLFLYDSTWNLYNNSISETWENLSKRENTTSGDFCNLHSLCVVTEWGTPKSILIYKCKLRRNLFHCPLTLERGKNEASCCQVMVKAVDFLIENFLQAIGWCSGQLFQEEKSLNTEGKTEDSVKVCSGEIAEKVKLVSTSVIKSAFVPGPISLNIAVLHHGDTRHRCFQSVLFLLV